MRQKQKQQQQRRGTANVRVNIIFIVFIFLLFFLLLLLLFVLLLLLLLLLLAHTCAACGSFTLRHGDNCCKEFFLSARPSCRALSRFVSSCFHFTYFVLLLSFSFFSVFILFHFILLFVTYFLGQHLLKQRQQFAHYCRPGQRRLQIKVSSISCLPCCMNLNGFTTPLSENCPRIICLAHAVDYGELLSL